MTKNALLFLSLKNFVVLCELYVSLGCRCHPKTEGHIHTIYDFAKMGKNLLAFIL